MSFNVELAISGGYGKSIDEPIIISKTEDNNYVETEYFILNCLGKVGKIEWKILKQALQHHNDKVFDVMTIETKRITEHENSIQIENYYFDISECFINEM